MEALKVRDLTLERQKEIMYDTLCNDRVRTAIILNNPETFEELGKTIDKHCRVEEIQRYSKPSRESIPFKALNRHAKRAHAPRRPILDRVEPRREGVHKEKGVDFANPFKHPIKTVYAMIKDQPFLTPVRPIMESKRSQASPFYCDYHQQWGHSTDRCLDLQKLLKSLVDQGYLQEFMKNNGDLSGRKRIRSPAIQSRIG